MDLGKEKRWNTLVEDVVKLGKGKVFVGLKIINNT
jgi:hypothetical protein